MNVDGKCLHGSDDQKLGKRAIYMVSAWAAENEITAILEFLKLLNLSECIVTIDAMGTQTAIAKTIQEGNADYVLRVKENHGSYLKIFLFCLA